MELFDVTQKSLEVALHGTELRQQVISNNLANVNTTGFKESRPQFQDLLYDTTSAAGAQQGGGNQIPASLQVGQGTAPVARNAFSRRAN